MSHWLIIATGMAYAACAVDQYLKGSPGTALMFAGYALSNIGIFMQAK